jgi:hypothetical protein
MKKVHCEVGTMGTFTYLVNGLVRLTCSSQTLHHTYDGGSVDSVMGRLSWVHTL